MRSSTQLKVVKPVAAEVDPVTDPGIPRAMGEEVDEFIKSTLAKMEESLRLTKTARAAAKRVNSNQVIFADFKKA
jgi:hypothetical protein